MSDTYHLTAAEIAEMAGTPKTHFLNERARRINKSLGDLTGLTGIGVHLIEVQPGDVTTEHHVHHQDNVLLLCHERRLHQQIAPALLLHKL